MSTPLGWGLAAREALGQVSRVLLSHDSAAIREVFGHSPVLVDQPSLTHTAHHRLDLGPVADLGGSHTHHMLDYMLDLDGQAPPPPRSPHPGSATGVREVWVYWLFLGDLGNKTNEVAASWASGPF